MRCAGVALGLFLAACGGDDDGGGARDGGGGGGDGGGRDDAGAPAFGCPARARPGGNVIEVTPDPADELPDIVRGAGAGDTISLADGTYPLPATLQMAVAGVTLRSASDDAAGVILDAGYTVAEAVQVSAADVTIAHLTITRAIDHPVHVVAPDGGPDVTGFLLYGAQLIDGGEQFLKVNPGAARDAWVDGGRVECSLFRLTDAGRPMVERDPGGCYTGGIDVHAGRGWIVRQNRFEDIYCAGEGLAEHAVHFWVGSRDTLIEDNVIVDCARAIGFGLGEAGNGEGRTYEDDPYPGAGYIGHYDGLIRNNAVWAAIEWFDTGIGLEQARGARVFHNTVVSADSAADFFASIDVRFDNSVATVTNNLTRRISQREGGSGTVESNAEMVDPAIFADAEAGDLHLAAGAAVAIDKGIAVEDAGLDLDGEPHTSGAPDLGCDER
jgi:hypothetical protein